MARRGQQRERTEDDAGQLLQQEQSRIQAEDHIQGTFRTAKRGRLVLLVEGNERQHIRYHRGGNAAGKARQDGRRQQRHQGPAGQGNGIPAQGLRREGCRDEEGEDATSYKQRHRLPIPLHHSRRQHQRQQGIHIPERPAAESRPQDRHQDQGHDGNHSRKRQRHRQGIRALDKGVHGGEGGLWTLFRHAKGCLQLERLQDTHTCSCH